MEWVMNAHEHRKQHGRDLARKSLENGARNRQMEGPREPLVYRFDGRLARALTRTEHAEPAKRLQAQSGDQADGPSIEIFF
jgi:hypothetical protein